MAVLLALVGCTIAAGCAVVMARLAGVGGRHVAAATVRLLERSELLLAEVARFQPTLGHGAMHRPVPVEAPPEHTHASVV